jgi:hypothetical protein
MLRFLLFRPHSNPNQNPNSNVRLWLLLRNLQLRWKLLVGYRRTISLFFFGVFKSTNPNSNSSTNPNSNSSTNPNSNQDLNCSYTNINSNNNDRPNISSKSDDRSQLYLQQ